ncbi:efflux transporter outer membrane subunit [Aquincola sp. S2]|uniref:Efflux transporter outer membrane subunit n=1 Tax=Pseudaquabacterium terrae TaxID=2732868 RepID=A0ABX2EFL7_9BURK|nr:efflux transporter outer membrane subunit [Aquabacterium terrae]NRF67415.1 efflux transporter outer membrane subunit [Aquabacterium terrae]
MKRLLTKTPTLSALALAALLAACASPGPAAPPIAADELPATQAIAPLPADWWKRFGDPQIDALVTEALANNRDLARALARIDESRAALRAADADRSPQVNAGVSGARQRASENGVIPGGGTGNVFSASIGVAYELDLWSRYAKASAAARAELLATEYARETLRTALAAQVVQSYATLQALDAQIGIYQQVLVGQRDGLRLQKLRLDAGELAELDWRQLEAELLNSELQLPKLDRARGEAERALALVLGRTPKALIEQGVQRSVAFVPAATALPEALPSDLLLRRPDVQAAEARLRAAGARVDVARAAYFPSISLSAAFGRESTELSKLLDGPSLIWNVVASLTQPIWNGGRLDAQRDAAQARRLQAELDYRDSVAIAFKEARDALAAHGEARSSADTSQRRSDALQRAAQLTKLRFEGGQVSRLLVLDAERLALLARLQTQDERRALIAAQAGVYRALGGGWQRPAGTAGE